MEWEVEYTDEFEAWWLTLSEEQQDQIVAAVELLEEAASRSVAWSSRRSPARI